MRWFILIAVVAAILVIFGAVYGISALVNKRKRPKYKTTAPDDDPKFLRDLAERLKADENQKPENNTDEASGDGNPTGDK